MDRGCHEIKGLVLVWESFCTERVLSGTGAELWCWLADGRESSQASLELWKQLPRIPKERPLAGPPDGMTGSRDRASCWGKWKWASHSEAWLSWEFIHYWLMTDWLTGVNWTAELLWSLQLTSCTWEAVQRFKCMENHERMMFPCFRPCPNSFLSVLHFLPLQIHKKNG